MKLINNRYKIKSIYEDEINGIVYIAEDLFQANKKILLKEYNDSEQNKLILDYFIKEYIHLFNIKNKYVLDNFDFDIIDTIDGSEVNEIQYFSTKEYVSKIRLKSVFEKFDNEKLIDSIIQICIAVDYLHFRGIKYQNLNLDNIYVVENNDRVNIKLLDIHTAIEKRSFYNNAEHYRYFLAPEIIENKENANCKSDIYSVGMLIYILIMGEIKEYNESEFYEKIRFNMDDITKKKFVELINSMIDKDPNIRPKNLTKVIKKFKQFSRANIYYPIKEEREKLNFNGKIIGREKDIDKVFEASEHKKKLVTILGESGIGKTRLIKELTYRLRMDKKSVYSISVSEESNREFEPITKILQQMIRYCSGSGKCKEEMINKYGCELIKLVPSLGDICKIKPSPTLIGNREKFRLYDRIINFMIETIENTQTYILIDDLHKADLETIKLIDFIIKKDREFPLLFVVTGDVDKFRNAQVEEYFTNWMGSNVVDVIKPSKLGIEDISELARNVLGMSYRPIKFTTALMNKAKGNPRFIEEIIKNLYSTGKLFINKKGLWETNAENYWDIQISCDIDKVIREQIDSINSRLYQIVKIIALFSSPVSKSVLGQILGISQVGLDLAIEELVNMKILNKMVEDWGFSYDFYNVQVKKYVYNNILEDEKIKLHKNVAIALEEMYIEKKDGSVDELIHHFKLSHQNKKAVSYAITFAEDMQMLLMSSQSILLWNNAYRLLDDEDNSNRLKIQMNLGKLYAKQGKNNKALEIYSEAIKTAQELKKYDSEVVCRNSMGEIHYRRNNVDVGERYILEAKKIAEKNEFIEGILESVVLINQIYMIRGESDKILKFTRKYLELAKNKGENYHLGYFHNQIGVVFMIEGEMEIALDYFGKSITYFEKSGFELQSNLSINNIGVMYSDHFDNIDKALEYFQKGHKLCEKYNSIQHTSIFLVNIGEVLMRKHQYKEALINMKKAKKMAKDLEDYSLIFLVNVNIALIYLYMGEYDKCFRLYRIINNEYDKITIEKQDVSRYFWFLSYFNYQFGQWDKAIEYSIKTMENSYKFDKKLYLQAESLLIISKWFKTNNIDEKQIKEIICKYKKTNSCGIQRENLLRFAYFAIIKGKVNCAKLLLDEDEKISEKFTTTYLDDMRNLLTSINTYELLLTINELKNSSYVEYKQTGYFLLGNMFYDKKEYYKAAKCYIVVLDDLHIRVKKIPDNRMRKDYLRVRDVEFIIHRLDIIAGVDKRRDFEKIEEYFNLTELENKFGYQKEFRKNFYAKEVIELNKIEDVILNFSDDYKRNLKIILEFAVNQTIAKEGYILINKENNEDVEVLVAKNKKSLSVEINHNILEVKQNKEGILFKNTFNNRVSSVMYNEKSFMCIPIVKNKSKFELGAERRRKTSINDENNIIGYIYLESDSLFNRFDKERFNIIKTLSQLAVINIDNYNLKIISSIDKMTGAYTRKHFDALFKQYFNKAQTEGFKFSVIMADIDKFKTVNDTFGHQKGDEVLSNVGRLILENVRKTDIVARYGGEEFIIIVNDADIEESRIIAEKIRKNVEKTRLLKENHPLTISLGISSFPSCGLSRNELIEKADQSLYLAKESGRNKTILWSNKTSSPTKRVDKLAGIITGNTVQDQRNVLVMIEIINLLKEKRTASEKIYSFLGRLVEIISAEKGILFIIDENTNIVKHYARERFINNWVDGGKYNEKEINQIVVSKMGKFFIDWDDVDDFNDAVNPSWQSNIITPIFNDGVLKGVLQVQVPITEKEFDYNSYNYVSMLGDMIGVIL